MDDEYEPLPLGLPTKAVPGSAEKVEVLRKRYEDGFQFWHPEDTYDFEGMKAEIEKIVS